MSRIPEPLLGFGALRKRRNCRGESILNTTDRLFDGASDSIFAPPCRNGGDAGRMLGLSWHV